MRTKFEPLFDEPDALVALSIVVHWRKVHRARDEDLHCAARALVDRGDLDERRWRRILLEAQQLDDCFVPGSDLKRYARFDALDLAVATGTPLSEEMQSELRTRLDLARCRPHDDEVRAEIAYLQAMISRAVASEHGIADA